MPFLVDPFLIALPRAPEATRACVEEYVVRLIRWEKQFAGACDKYVLSQWVFESMQALDIVPATHTLDRLLRSVDLQSIYSAKDISPTSSGVIANTPYIEEREGVLDIESEIECVVGTDNLIPDEIKQRLPADVAAAFVKSLAYVSFVLETRKAENQYQIATAPLEDTEAVTLRVEATFETLESNALSLSVEWGLLADPEYLYADHDITEYYVERPGDAVYATWCRLISRGKLKSERPNMDHIRFGDGFISSILKSNAFRTDGQRREHVPRIFETIVFIAVGAWSFNGDKFHALRKDVLNRHSEPISRPRLTINGAVTEYAARADVTTGTPCIRLHLWRCHDGGYEFANVTDLHNDATILG